jgi:hypothetical protein
LAKELGPRFRGDERKIEMIPPNWKTLERQNETGATRAPAEINPS